MKCQCCQEREAEYEVTASLSEYRNKIDRLCGPCQKFVSFVFGGYVRSITPSEIDYDGTR